MGKGNEQGLVALVRQAIFTVLDEASPRTPGIAWDFNDDEQRVDFADRVASFIPSASTATREDDDLHSFTMREAIKDGLPPDTRLVHWSDAVSLRMALLRSQSATGSITPHPDTLWVVWFEDKDHGHEVFFGPGAEDGARRRYKEALDNWSCHLLVRVPTDSRSNK